MQGSSHSWLFLALVTASVAILSSLVVEKIADEISASPEPCRSDDDVEHAASGSHYKLPGGGDSRQKFWAN